ncbi:MAG: hypothetical protein NVSMB1_24870 [Polyangiales bacterium]
MRSSDHETESATGAKRALKSASPVPWRVHIALFFVQIAFASSAIVGKLALNVEKIDPTALASLRAVGGAVAFQGARLLSRSPRRPTLADHGRLVMYAILGVCVNQAFFLHGLKHASATSATLLSATIPVFTAAVAALHRQERLTVRMGMGIAVATSGVVTLVGVRDISLGNLLIAINSLSYAFYLVGIRPLLHRLGALTTIAWIFTYGALLLLPFGARAIVVDCATWTPHGLLLIGWIVAVPTIFAYFANAFALERANASLVAAYVYLQPLLVIALAKRMLGELLTARLATAAALILIGLGIVVTRGRARIAKVDATR